MFASLKFNKPFGNTKIYHKNRLPFFAKTHAPVVWLHVSMQPALAVHVLQSRNHLIGQKQGSLYAKLTITIVKQGLQARTKQIHHHCVIVTIKTKPAHLWYAFSTGQKLVYSVLLV